MTRAIIGALVVLVALTALGIYDGRREAAALSAQVRAVGHTRDSLKARLAEAIMTQAPARVDTVRTVVESVRTLRDSVVLNITDTMEVLRYIWKTDTLRATCLACAALLDTIRLRYADEKRATESYISLLQGEIKRAKRMSWKDRVGCGIGYGVQKVGSDVYAGPQVGCQIRAWP